MAGKLNNSRSQICHFRRKIAPAHIYAWMSTFRNQSTCSPHLIGWWMPSRLSSRRTIYGTRQARQGEIYVYERGKLNSRGQRNPLTNTHRLREPNTSAFPRHATLTAFYLLTLQQWREVELGWKTALVWNIYGFVLYITLSRLVNTWLKFY